MRARLAGLALGLFAAPAAAHDFWIEPNAFQARPGEAIELRFLIGEPGAVEHWRTLWHKVVSLQDFAVEGEFDLTASIEPLGDAAPALDRVDARFALTDAGTHIVAFTSNQALSDLSAAEFEDYARHEGLTLPLTRRAATGTSAANGRELYSRRAKALVQVGDNATDTVSRPIGQTLEIVPTSNPYQLREKMPLGLRVLFHGRPLEGATVTLDRLGPGAGHGQTAKTDVNGEVDFDFERAGSWKAGVVWSYPIEDPRAEYETIFSSLTFGF